MAFYYLASICICSSFFFVYLFLVNIYLSFYSDFYLSFYSDFYLSFYLINIYILIYLDKILSEDNPTTTTTTNATALNPETSEKKLSLPTGDSIDKDQNFNKPVHR